MAGTAVTEPPPRRLRVARSITLSPWTVLTGVFFAAVLAYYLWTAATSDPLRFNKAGSDYYGLIADALRHGHLALRIQPPQGLLDLPNPYDPNANAQFRYAGGLHDLSLRNGHLYAYWGPTAAIVLFAPFQLLGIEISQSFAVALFGFLGFVFSVMTLSFLVRRFLPGTPRWALAAGSVFLAFGNALPFVLRRPGVYEVAITCALCFGMLGLWLLLTGWFGPRPSWRRLAAASLALGLALASRPTLGALAIVPLVLAVAAWRRGAWPQGVTQRQAVVALAVPFLTCGLLLAAYNAARFGSPLEFGQKFQLAGGDPADLKTFDPAFIPSGLYLYLLAPPRPLALFPFLVLSWPPALPWATPEGFDYTEMTGGALILAPLLLWTGLLPFIVRRMEPELRRVLLALVAAGAVIVLAMSFILAGTTQRYAVDFMALLSLSALLIWMVTLARTKRGSWRRRIAAGSGLAVLAWGTVAGLALGFGGYYNTLEVNHPKLYHHLQDVFGPLSAVETRVSGRAVIGEVSSLYGSGPGKVTWGSLGQGDGAGFYVGPAPVAASITIAAPRAGTYHLRGQHGDGPGVVTGSAPVMVVAHTGEPDRRITVGGPQNFDLPLKLKAGVSRIFWTASAKRANSPQLAVVQGLTIAGPDR
jgi:hypothetical protein